MYSGVMLKKGWSGTALFVDSNVPIRNLKITRTGVHNTSIECKIGGTWSRFSSFYFPINKLHADEIRDFFHNNNNTFFGGDSNARHVEFGDDSSNIYGQILLDIAKNTDLQIFNSSSPTCFRALNGSFIDKFISNSNLIPCGEVRSFATFSDHFAIQCYLPLAPANKPDGGGTCRLFNKAPIGQMNSAIEVNLKRQVMPLRSNILNGDCEQLAKNFNEAFASAVKKFVPCVDQKTKILLNAEGLAVQRALKQRQRRLYRLGGGFRLPPGSISQINTEIKLLKGMLLAIVGSQTNKFFMDAYGSIKSNMDAFRVIKRYTRHKKREPPPVVVFNDDDKINGIVGNENISNLFANRFHFNNELTLNYPSAYAGEVYGSVITLANVSEYIKFNDQITPDIRDNDELAVINALLPSGQVGLLTCAREVRDVVESRPNKNSTGSDELPYTIIKTFNDEIIRGITILFNHLIAVSYFPICWQEAIITAIPKPNKDSTMIKNWRPISMLTCISKIFERIIAKRLNCHTGKLGIYDNQFGFLNNNSTIHAMTNFQNQVNEGLNNGRVTTLVALDLQAAFDTVWHSGLLQHPTQISNYDHQADSILLEPQTFFGETRGRYF